MKCLWAIRSKFAYGSRVPLVLHPITVEHAGEGTGVQSSRPESSRPSGNNEGVDSLDSVRHGGGMVNTTTSPSMNFTIPGYRLIGTCYLHGIMDGEALADPALEAKEVLLC